MNIGKGIRSSGTGSPFRLNLLRRTAATFAIATIAATTCLAVVCRLEYIGGFESEYKTAKRAIGAQTTSDVSQAKIFLTKKGQDIYAHSNFISSNAEKPTKLAEPVGAMKDLESLVGNLIYSSEAAFRQDPLNIAEAMATRIKFYADDNFFNSEGVPTLDMSSPIFVNHVDAVGNVTPLMPTGSPRPPPFAAVLSNSLRVKFLPGSRPYRLLTRLRDVKFKKKEFAFLNLIEEHPVESAIMGSALKQYQTTSKIPTTEGEVFENIRRNQGKILTALFHSDGNSMVIEDPSGKVVLRIPLAKIARVAEEAKCVFVGLGCTSGHAEVAAGSLEAFNPVDAVNSINDALGASSMAEFAERLTGGKFKLVFDEKLIDSSLHFEAHKPIRDYRGITKLTVLSLIGLLVIPTDPPSIVQSSSGGDGGGDGSSGSDRSQNGSGKLWLMATALILAGFFVFRKIIR